MDVRLPDGTVIRNIPDGTSKADLVAKLKTNGYDVSKLESPEKPVAGSQPLPSTGERLARMGMAGARALPSGPIGMLASMGAEGMNQFGEATDRVAHKAGEAVSQAIAKTSLPAEVAGAAGYLTNVGMQAIPALGGAGIGKAVGAVTSKLGEPLMRIALKPSKVLGAVDQNRAVDTMLNADVGNLIPGANVTSGGIGQILGKVDELSKRVSDILSQSGKRINPENVTGEMEASLNKFGSQVNPDSDVAALKSSLEQFRNHPSVKYAEDNLRALEDKVRQLEASKASALQDAGKFRTFEAQQENLAHGGGIDLAKNQRPNTPYINVGAGGGRAVSPSAYPVEGYPRIPGKYTENAQRVPEGGSAFEDAMRIYRQRSAEETAARQALDDFVKQGTGIPIKRAQELKQGTYRALGDKAYSGELKAADVEGQKALASGLRKEIEKAEPGVAPLNAETSDLLNAVKVAISRDAIAGNRDPISLGFLAAHPVGALGFMANRSELIKSQLARLLAHGSEVGGTGIGATLGGLLGAQSGKQP